MHVIGAFADPRGLGGGNPLPHPPAVDAGATTATAAPRSRDRSGHWITTTAASTSTPPASWTGRSDSPNTAAARPTVTTGSTTERIAARDGPTRARPAKNSRIAATVLTSAIAPSQAQPAAPK